MTSRLALALGSLAALTVAAIPAHALDIKLGLQARPRLEKSFAGNLEARPLFPNYELSQRTRVSVDAAYEMLRARASIQDVRIWASENTTLSFSTDTIDFHEGWIEAANDWAQIRVGRQEIVINEERLIGREDWEQQGRAFDAVWARLFSPNFYDVQVFWARVQDRGPDHDLGQHDLIVLNPSMVLADFDLRLPLHLQTNAGVPSGDRGESRHDWTRFTGGIYLAGKHGDFAWRAEGYGQFGTNPHEPGGTAAFMLGARLSYHFHEAFTPTLWVDYLSGDSNHEDDQAEAFDTLYGSNFPYYGLLDRFVDIPLDTRDGGLVDIALKNEGHLGPGRLTTDLHLFSFAQRNEVGQEGPLGVELDLAYAMPIVSMLSASVGFCLLFDVGDFTKRFDVESGDLVPKNKTVHDYLYVMLNAEL